MTLSKIIMIFILGNIMPFSKNVMRNFAVAFEIHNDEICPIILLAKINIIKK